MKATDLVKFALKASEDVVSGLVEDLKDCPLQAPTPNGGNHPLWTIGHLAYSEGALGEIITGEPNPLAAWKDLFDAGTEPVDDASHYPSFDEVLSQFKQMREATWKLIETLTDEDLDKATEKPPEGMEDFFANYGQILLLIGLHTMHHRGQLADVRRALGRQPVMM